jgi:predicted O-linked N-acetylglucosamine transferase (SPINDLY family)
MYSTLSDNKKALEYAEKGIRLAKAYKVNTSAYINSITTFLFCSNFSYHVKETLLPKYKLLNTLVPRAPKYDTIRMRDPTKKIRIGYVSSDFIGHAVSNFILPILQNHNQDLFEVVLFPNNIRISEELLELGIEYHNIFKLKDKEAADLIHSLEIDILIELNGYTGNNRVAVLSYCPAPVQISYLGYPNTLGTDFIQYRITDEIVDPVDTIQYYSETLIRLPKCFLLYQPWHQTEPTKPRKTKGTVILGSLNKENKTSPEVLNTWKQILQECPNTKLLIKLDTTDDKAERVLFYKEKLGVSENQLILITKTDKETYSKLFGMIDVLLDTFPYSGTTTTCNALYNSIPVVTLYQRNCHAHNVSTYVLKNCHLEELVAYSTEEYIEKVKSLVTDASRIDAYKNTIHRAFVHLMNPSEFMGVYENNLQSFI